MHPGVRFVAIVLLTALSSVMVLAGSQSAVLAQARYTYISPHPGATFVPPATTVALRFGVMLDPGSVAAAPFDVVGSRSGVHRGQAVLATDAMTAIFRPDQPFAPGETVSVRLGAGLRTSADMALAPLDFSFTIAPGTASRPPHSLLNVASARMDAPTAPAPSARSAADTYLTLPDDFPVITATVATDQVDDGMLFVSTFRWGMPQPPAYLLILDRIGEPVYYRQLPDVTLAADFKLQPNGLLTYHDNVSGVFHALDASYTEVGTYQAGNGYTTDVHELQILPNGHALLMIYNPRAVDMSKVVAGGLSAAVVLDLVIQELDRDGNVVFQWDSKDHVQITDTTEELVNVSLIDYVHGNAIELDRDGNLLISSRHLDEITKIDRQTGAVIWRLGGKQNQFTFTNDQPFVHQHDIRRLPNGHITLFDNRTDRSPAYSRAVEYQIDETARTITRVWEYRNTPDTYSLAMGSAQRLPNGNTLIGWGSSQRTLLTEVAPDGTKALELQVSNPLVSYRAQRMPWRGQPSTRPTLVTLSDTDTTTLAYSWNGATDVAAYKVYGGMTSSPVRLLTTQPRTGFETRTTLTRDQPLACFFRVVPLDGDGNELRASEVIQDYGPRCARQIHYMPLVRGSQ